MLTFDELKQLASKPTKVEIPDLGGFVYVKKLTPKLAKQLSGGDGFDYASRLIHELVCDENGNALFSPEQIEEIDAHSISKIVEAITAASVPSGNPSAQTK